MMTYNIFFVCMLNFSDTQGKEAQFVEDLTKFTAHNERYQKALNADLRDALYADFETPSNSRSKVAEYNEMLEKVTELIQKATLRQIDSLISGIVKTYGPDKPFKSTKALKRFLKKYVRKHDFRDVQGAATIKNTIQLPPLTPTAEKVEFKYPFTLTPETEHTLKRLFSKQTGVDAEQQLELFKLNLYSNPSFIVSLKANMLAGTQAYYFEICSDLNPNNTYFLTHFGSQARYAKDENLMRKAMKLLKVQSKNTRCLGVYAQLVMEIGSKEEMAQAREMLVFFLEDPYVANFFGLLTLKVGKDEDMRETKEVLAYFPKNHHCTNTRGLLTLNVGNEEQMMEAKANLEPFLQDHACRNTYNLLMWVTSSQEEMKKKLLKRSLGNLHELDPILEKLNDFRNNIICKNKRTQLSCEIIRRKKELMQEILKNS